jgi:hypothetical protein
MSEEYSLEEIELTEDFSRTIYNWYCENRIVNHALARADFVKGHNQRVNSIFQDLNELRFLIEERKTTEALCCYSCMGEEVLELIPQTIVDHLEKLKTEHALIENNDDDF